MNEIVVRTVGLSKRYRGGVLALDRADLRIERAEIYGFLGLNGAGKTTAIRMLLGMISPTAGHAELFGRRVHAEAIDLWRRVGHLVETAAAYPGLTMRENLEVARRLQDARDRTAVDRAIEKLGLGEYAGRPARTLSLGNLQRLALARAMLHDPELLILDEPANGLDPAGVIEIRELLRTLARERGTTVLMSSHILTEVDRLATRIGIVHRGRMIEEQSADELERRRNRRLNVGARDLAAADAALRKAGFDPQPARDADPPLLELREVRALDAPDSVAKLLAEAGAPPTHMAVAQEDLEQHFMRLTADAESRTA
ncbi:MAG: ABC transporter ATP-binding protein [candidate division WOR-3 bacterium]|nr:ABC transporter ATP-binding protein [candidate division WOR-3 bacterium]